MTQHQAYLSILQITDMHILHTPGETLVGIDTEHYFHAVLNLAFANDAHFDLVLVTGDLAQTPCPESYQRILQRLETLQTPCLCLPGNHDDFSLMQKILETDLVSCRRQTLLGDWQFICLNSQIIGSAGGRLEQEELDLLERCLTEYPQHHTVIAVHHHCLPSQSVWMDTMTIENYPALFELLKPHPQVKLILTGHIHQIMDQVVDMIRILGTPSTCFQFKPKSVQFAMESIAPGYRTLQLYSDGRIESEVIRLAHPPTGLQINTKGY